MPSGLYQIIAMAARPVFLALALLVALRAMGRLLGQHNARKRLLKRLPDAGMVGEMRDIESDRSYPLPREGVLGGGRASDIRLRGLRRRQVSFAFVDGKGLLLTPCHRRSATWLDGVPLTRPAYALHGAILRAGGYTLCIRMFAGLNVPDSAQLQNHWQPAFEEDLYAPEEIVFTPVEPPDMDWPLPEEPWGGDFAEDVPEEDTSADVPVFDLTPDAPEESPLQTGAPVRHRRSDRRRNQ